MHPDLIPSTSYPATWYAASTDTGPGYPALGDSVRSDVCIVGAGLAGLSIGHELARRGVNVTIVEAGRVAWGASGRNGGFVTPGFAADYEVISARVGEACARRLFDYSLLGVERVRSNIAALSPESLMGEGKLMLSRHPAAQAMADETRHLTETLGQEATRLDASDIRTLVQTTRYQDGIRKPNGFHIHPLRFALALARDFARLGGRLFEGSPAQSIRSADAGGWRVATPQGEVSSRQLVICTSGYDQKLYKPVSSSVLPVATHVAVTAPLTGSLRDLIRTAACIADTRNAGDYYRMIADDRLLWGGLISTLKAPPGALDQVMRRAMVDVYPELVDVPIDYSWSGLMGYCRHRMPVIRQTDPGLWVATAFGGHGLNTTAMAGELVASAIADGDTRYRDFDGFGLRWGGGVLGQAAVQSSYWWMQFGDRLAERRARPG